MVFITIHDKLEELPTNRVFHKCVPPFQLESALANTTSDYLCNLNMNSRCPVIRLSGLICVIGIASSEVEKIERLIESGMNVACLNFTHGSVQYHSELLANIRTASRNYDKKIGTHCPISVAIKLKGHIIRCFPLGAHCIEISLYKDSIVKLSGDLDYVIKANEKKSLYINYHGLHNVVQVGGRIIIGNKQVELVCIGIEGIVVICKVVKGGEVSSRKQVYLLHAPVEFPPLTERDRVALNFAIEEKLDIVIVPFVRNAAAVKTIRELLKEQGSNTMICSQIDTADGLANIDEIIQASDAILLNRGELGNEIELKKIFLPQKSIIAKCNQAGKPVICTKHFLRSMITNPRPTRAESCDFANAILEGADCILIHHETAFGDYTDVSIQCASKICKEAEAAIWQKRVICDLSDQMTPPVLTMEALATAAVLISLRILASAIIVISTTMKSAEMLSQFRPKCPLIVVTRNTENARKAHLYRGIIPLIYRVKDEQDWNDDVEARTYYGINFGRSKGFIQAGDPVVILSPSHQGSGFTDKMQIMYVTKTISAKSPCPC